MAFGGNSTCDVYHMAYVSAESIWCFVADLSAKAITIYSRRGEISSRSSGIGSRARARDRALVSEHGARCQYHMITARVRLLYCARWEHGLSHLMTTERELKFYACGYSADGILFKSLRFRFWWILSNVRRAVVL